MDYKELDVWKSSINLGKKIFQNITDFRRLLLGLSKHLKSK